ncbi:MAG: Sua5/YciO/YrdC/YwlC family protein [Campylobacterota bacterium]|nr:Sua5/YciO/YrdC/YwlC family protein [Campylobacterota bacterium]
MVFFNSNSRLSSINSQVILAQTDTTVGFLSQNQTKLQEIKSRDTSKPFIVVYQDFKTFSTLGHRVPNSKKSLIRRSKKTTFIVNGVAFRVANHKSSSHLLRGLKWSYSTSANKSGKNFDRNFCESKADIIIENKDGLREESSSSLYKLNSKKIKRLR